eukprot:GILK01016182.1.p1 GENE.GILK01016182.1~~GILK01016182.1.p1  ORF type:complete len:165 (+),score=16.86 GILK01016182.1:197-691(+)
MDRPVESPYQRLYDESVHPQVEHVAYQPQVPPVYVRQHQHSVNSVPTRPLMQTVAVPVPSMPMQYANPNSANNSLPLPMTCCEVGCPFAATGKCQSEPCPRVLCPTHQQVFRAGGNSVLLSVCNECKAHRQKRSKKTAFILAYVVTVFTLLLMYLAVISIDEDI